MASARRPVRVAACSASAFFDRKDGVLTLARNASNDHIDVILEDWSSNHITGPADLEDASASHAIIKHLTESLRPALCGIAQNSTKLVITAGSIDKEKLYNAIVYLIKDQQLDLKVAYVSGDDLLPQVLESFESKAPDFAALAALKQPPVSARAPLGGFGIATALQSRADIVICGHLEEGSAALGAAVWWHGWERSQTECLANALTAGHLIQHSSNVTGGNYTGFKTIQQQGNAGFPIAELSSSGRVVITKNRASAGELSVGTCTAQLLRGLPGPFLANSDVVARLDKVSFEQLSSDRVSLHGVYGTSPPPTTVVVLKAKAGFRASVHFTLAGLDMKEKAGILRASIEQQISAYVDRFSSLDFTLTGSSASNPPNQASATVDFCVTAEAPSAADLTPEYFTYPCLAATMSSAPGVAPSIDLQNTAIQQLTTSFTMSVPQSDISHIVHLPWLLESSSSTAESTISISAPTSTSSLPPASTSSTSQSSSLTPAGRKAPRTYGGATDAAGGWAELPAQRGRSTLREVFGNWGRTARGPLGWIVHARSNRDPHTGITSVGFWVRHRGGEYDWLCSILTTQKLKELLGRDEYRPAKAQGKEVKPILRTEFPGLKAVHFVIPANAVKSRHDTSSSATESASAATLTAFAGDNVAEYLRARFVDLPTKFLDRGKI